MPNFKRQISFKNFFLIALIFIIVKLYSANYISPNAHNIIQQDNITYNINKKHKSYNFQLPVPEIHIGNPEKISISSIKYSIFPELKIYNLYSTFIYNNLIISQFADYNHLIIRKSIICILNKNNIPHKSSDKNSPVTV
jgi:hypothetical protein